jgi:hypothetical protein
MIWNSKQFVYLCEWVQLSMLVACCLCASTVPKWWMISYDTPDLPWNHIYDGSWSAHRPRGICFLGPTYPSSPHHRSWRVHFAGHTYSAIYPMWKSVIGIRIKIIRRYFIYFGIPKFCNWSRLCVWFFSILYKVLCGFFDWIRLNYFKKFFFLGGGFIIQCELGIST